MEEGIEVGVGNEIESESCSRWGTERVRRVVEQLRRGRRIDELNGHWLGREVNAAEGSEMFDQTSER
jgi:hypothetical protein